MSRNPQGKMEPPFFFTLEKYSRKNCECFRVNYTWLTKHCDFHVRFQVCDWNLLPTSISKVTTVSTFASILIVKNHFFWVQCSRGLYGFVVFFSDFWPFLSQLPLRRIHFEYLKPQNILWEIVWAGKKFLGSV